MFLSIQQLKFDIQKYLLCRHKSASQAHRGRLARVSKMNSNQNRNSQAGCSNGERREGLRKYKSGEILEVGVATCMV